MSEIFISHATADAALAKRLTNFLKEGMGVPQDAIFCSSVAGHGIPLGEDFSAYIRDQIQTPRLVILLMTPAYMESEFCLMELGAAWAAAHKSLPIVVPPIAFDAVTRTLGLKQAWAITNHKGLVDVRELVQGSVSGLEKRSDHVWDDKRAEWIDSLPAELADLAPARKVDAGAHQATLDDRDNLLEELAASARARDALAADLKAVKALKDAKAVKTLERASAGVQSAQAAFDALMEAMEAARPKGITNAVLRHIIMGYYDKAAPINWMSGDAEDFTAAIHRNLISEDDHRVRWGNPKMDRIQKAIEAVAAFLGSDEGRALARANPDRVWEPDDLEFWEDRL